ncbi:hypothetical protein, variant [Capsaspora owczarzaki ATCC 30864]|nr:hypothetical protein, variant [Capsaspora owczarzaki ATCC 30864]
MARGALKAALERLCSREDVVIVDSLNYIKGFRYELFCISRAMRTPQCTIYCAAPAAEALAANMARSDDHVTESQFHELVQRFETPEERNRWESPLVTVQFTDRSELPFEHIVQILDDVARLPLPNLGTSNPPVAPADFLHELDTKTQEVVTFLLGNAASFVPGDSVAVPNSSERFIVPATLTQAALRKHKRQFVTLAQAHAQVHSRTTGVQSVDSLSSQFVRHLNASMR